MDQLYMIEGEPFSHDEVVAGRRRFRRLRKFGKHIEELLVSPLPNWLIVLGYVAGGVRNNFV